MQRHRFGVTHHVAGSAPEARIVEIDRLEWGTTDEVAEEGMVQAEYELILYAARAPRIAARLLDWEAAQRAHFEAVLRAAGAPRPAEGARTLMALVRGLEIERLTTGAPIRSLRRRLEPVIGALVGQPAPD
jgi:hypothetical protein